MERETVVQRRRSALFELAELVHIDSVILDEPPEVGAVDAEAARGGGHASTSFDERGEDLHPAQ